MNYDVNRIRSHFPSLESGLAFFDGPGGSQVPDVVGAAIARAITMASSNRGVTTLSELNANKEVLDFRSAVGDLLNVDRSSSHQRLPLFRCSPLNTAHCY